MPNTPPPSAPWSDSGRDADLDARAFAAFAGAQDRLDLEAATWVARKRDGLDARGEAELQAWLDADPRHAGAFDDMDASFGALRRLPEEDVAALKATLPEHVPGTAVPPRPGSFFPRAAAVAVVFLAIGGGWLGWRQLPTFEQAYATGQGQQLTVSLPDADREGSTLQLDTATRIEARLYRDRREVHLAEGQTMLTVHPEARRPLHVLAGSLRITVVGTRFSVRYTRTGLEAGRTVVSVEEGRVRVARADGSDPGREASAADATIELTAGQQVVADAHGRMGPVTRVSPAAIAPWRDGRLSFDQTPLAQAIAEFERYGYTGLVVRDPVVAALPVGGSYSLQQFPHFVATLPQVLPVRLIRRGEVTEVTGP